MPEKINPASPSIESVEAGKRLILERAIQITLPLLAEGKKDLAKKFATQTLEDIRNGNNPDLEPKFIQKIKELGIDISQ